MADDFYRKLSLKQKNERRFGQICWVPCPCVSGSTIALRLPHLKAGTDLTRVNLQTWKLKPEEFGSLSAQDRANIKQKMPIPELGLELSDELTVVKAKLRPAVLVHHRCLNWREEARNVAARAAGTTKPERHLFAPVFSLKKEDGSVDYPPEFIAAVRNDEYPNILFLPAYSNELKYDSMLVLSDAFMAGLFTFRPTDLCIDPETLASKLMDWSDFLTTNATALDDELKQNPIA